jgi:hypothetical protein
LGSEPGYVISDRFSKEEVRTFFIFFVSQLLFLCDLCALCGEKNLYKILDTTVLGACPRIAKIIEMRDMGEGRGE